MRSSSDLLDISFEGLKNNFKVFAAIGVLISASLSLLAFVLGIDPTQMDTEFIPGGSAIIYLLISIPIGMIANLAILAAAIDPLNASLPKAFTFVQNNFIRYIFVNAVYTIIVLLGFIALIIPGIYLSIALCFCIYISLVERLSAVDSVKRSYELVKGRWVDVFVRLAFLTFICIVVYMPVVILSFVITDPYSYSFISGTYTYLITAVGSIYMFKLYNELNASTVTAPDSQITNVAETPSTAQ